MILAVDVDYRNGGGAVAAGLLFGEWTAAAPARVIVTRIEAVRAYRPGRFFERELPCILALLDQTEAPELIVVDGYAWLGAEREAGLGARLHMAVGLPVVGVAKTRFAGTPREAAVLRGRSTKPLFVTAAGISEERARAIYCPCMVSTVCRPSYARSIGRPVPGSPAASAPAAKPVGDSRQHRASSGRQRLVKN